MQNSLIRFEVEKSFSKSFGSGPPRMLSSTLKLPNILPTTTSVTRLGDLLDFGQLFKAFDNN